MTRPPAAGERAHAAVAPRAPPAPPPPAKGPLRERDPRHRPAPTYTVKRGDTLAQIALDNGLDYRDLAAWNSIENPNVIRVGQVLVLAAPGDVRGASRGGAGTAVTTPLAAPHAGAHERRSTPTNVRCGDLAAVRARNTPTLKAEPKALKLPYSEQALAQLQAMRGSAASTRAVPPSRPPRTVASVAAAPAAPPTARPRRRRRPPRPDAARVPEIDDDKIDWVWPATGKVIAGFSETANLKGIDIAGKAGQPVVASAAGRVVYAGTGLRGYGKLIIVKHNNTFLSAYAHNRDILVKEGQQVGKGQKISEMGDTDADQVKLHFEIRRLGKPVDPAKFLPPA